MTNRRKFVQNSLLTGLAAPLLPATVAQAVLPTRAPKASWKHWVWTNPNQKDTEAQLAERYRSYQAVYHVPQQHQR